MDRPHVKTIVEDENISPVSVQPAAEIIPRTGAGKTVKTLCGGLLFLIGLVVMALAVSTLATLCYVTIPAHGQLVHNLVATFKEETTLDDLIDQTDSSDPEYDYLKPLPMDKDYNDRQNEPYQPLTIT